MNVNLRYRSLLKVSGASQAVQESWILERVARACSFCDVIGEGT